MTLIQTRLYGILFGSTLGIGILATIVYQSVDRLESYQQKLLESHEMVTLLAQPKGLTDSHYDQLKNFRKNLEPEDRKNILSAILQSHLGNNPSEVNRLSALFAENESKYRNFVQSRVKYFKRRISYYGILGLSLALIVIFSLGFYVKWSLLGPIQDLTHRMMDFLHQRYTYEFTVPKPNEVGHLHSTFNALAQKVLNNMEELKDLDRAKSEFLSIASHELRTPLTSIKGSLSLLATGVGGVLDPKSAHLVGIAETETDRLIRLINDLLDLAKIEARKFPLAKGWLSLHELVQQCFDGLHGLAQTAQVELQSSGKLDVELYADRDRIQQVLTNLLSNAIKYSPPNGVVVVNSVVTEDSSLLIEVVDQGRGISPEDQELIFQRFRQATGPKNPLVKGTGLGLAIAKALVEEHEGQLTVRSSPGKGSTFCFTLKDWRDKIVEQTEGKENNKLGAAA